MDESAKTHWESVYGTKTPQELSWTQEVPQISLDLIRDLGLPKTARILDVGGGDSKLVDCLLAEGFSELTVLDISEQSLKRAQARLGDQAQKVRWVVSDITEFKAPTRYDLWHDRAAFHFLTRPEQVKKYLETANASVSGYLVIGTFSEQGPKKCSGLEIRQYSEASLAEAFAPNFRKLQCRTEDHLTPFGTKQNFLFCSFARS